MDEAVAGVLDECDSYLEAIEELRVLLKQAFFSLAQAKYAMGADKVICLCTQTMDALWSALSRP